MEFLAGAYTDVGTRKTINQDAFALRIVGDSPWSIAFAVVCDGVGGMTEGEIASGVAAQAFAEWFERRAPELSLALPEQEEIFREWNELAQRVNRCIYVHAQRQGVHIGTTATVFLAAGEQGFAMNIGDTRLYCVEAEQLRVVTKDNTLVQQEIDRGVLSEEEALTDKRRHILIRCLGAEETAQPDFYFGRLRVGSSYLLCSDGFRNQQSPAELRESFRADRFAGEGDIAAALRSAAERAKARGETDNITAVCLCCQVAGDAEQTLDLENAAKPRLSRESIRAEARALWRGEGE